MVDTPSPEKTRRPGVEALFIGLADGNDWGLALPSIRLSPRVVEEVDSLGRPTSRIEVRTRIGYPLEITQLIDQLRLACQQNSTEWQYEALIQLAAALIIRAHEITLSDAVSLLEVGSDDLPRLVEAVLSVVTGGAR